jgi:hypothetical protein
MAECEEPSPSGGKVILIDRSAKMVLWAVGAALIIFLVAAVYLSVFRTAGTAKATARTIASSEGSLTTSAEATELPPFNAKGTPSYTVFERTATPGQWKALADLHGMTVERAKKAVHQHVLVEEVEGLDYYVRVVGPEGLNVTNTGPNRTSYTTLNTTLKPGDTYLVWDRKLKSVPPGRRNKESIRRKCGNPIIRRGPGGPGRPGRPGRPRRPRKGRNPWDPHRPGSPVYINPPASGTDGYEPGNAERVHEEQQSQPPGGRDPTPSGTPGSTGGGDNGGGGGTSDTGNPDSGAGGETSDGNTGDVQ